MVRVLFDTNILIDYLNGVLPAKIELDLYQDKAISMITWMEVQVGVSPGDQKLVDQFLLRFSLLSIDAPVAAQAVVLRKASKVKLPDAIIWATAQLDKRVLVTRNTKDFSSAHPGIRVPYVI
ncbi:MAG: type II toxin-antitoxin system VapC family toxin [Rhodoferax sp.]|nr:type II toxin-antitoxin system VapC family toxin [Rhodoferax sp.]